MPQIPRNVLDVNVTAPWSRTWTDEKFLLWKDNQWGILVFGTKENMVVLKKCRYIYIDGTFRTAPKPYLQHVTIHGRFGNRVIHLASCLMTGKSIGQYREVLQALKRGVRAASGQRLRPKHVVCDFELSIITAVQTEFPQAKVCGCVFHLNQSLYRKISALGLKTPFQRDMQLRSALMKILSLCYLPLALMRINFVRLVRSATFQALVANYPSLRDFSTYMRVTYFDGNFPPSTWNCFTRNAAARTNNFVESKNHGLVDLN
jgi:hypothetical protein